MNFQKFDDQSNPARVVSGQVESTGAVASSAGAQDEELISAAIDKKIRRAEQILNSKSFSLNALQNAFRIAVSNGNIAMANLLLSRGANVNGVDEFQQTALMSASLIGDCAMEEWLMRNGADLKIKNQEGLTAFMLAARRSDRQEILQIYLSSTDAKPSPADINQAFLQAAQFGAASILPTLVHHADLKNSDWQEALKLALEHGHIDVIRQLLTLHKKLIDSLDQVLISAKESSMDTTAIDIALEYHRVKVLKKLIESNQAIPMTSLKNAQDKSTIMHIALTHQRFDVVEKLLELGMPIPKTSLNQSLLQATTAGNAKVVRWLLEHEADPKTRGEAGLTAFMLAVRYDQLNIINIYLESTIAKPTPEEIQQAVFIAAQYGATKVLSELQKAGANLTMQNSKGKTALNIALKNNQIDVVASLINSRIDIPAKDLDKAIIKVAEKGQLEAAFRVALAFNRSTVIDRLMRMGMNAEDHTDFLDETLMHAFRDDIKLLTEKGAIKDARALLSTILKIACDYNRIEVVAELWRSHVIEDKVLDTALLQATKTAEGQEAAMEIALSCERIEMIKQLTTMGMEVSEDALNWALTHAVKTGEIDVLKNLLDIGANPNIRDDEELTMFELAAIQNHAVIVDFFLSSKVVPLSNEDIQQAAFLAAKYGAENVLKTLIGAGADLEKVDKDGLTVIDNALARNYFTMVFDLATVTAVPTVSLDAALLGEAKNGQSKTAFKRACEFNRIEVAAEIWLKYQGISDNALDAAIKNAALTQQTTALNVALRCERFTVLEELEHSDRKLPLATLNQTLLQAAKEGKDDLVEWLLNNNRADSNIKDAEGLTALMLAAKHDNISVVRIFLDPLRSQPTSQDLQQALFLAAQDGAVNVLKKLKEAGASLDQRNSEGKTAMDLALDNNQYYVVKKLVDLGVMIPATSLEQVAQLAAEFGDHKLLLQCSIARNPHHADATEEAHINKLATVNRSVESILRQQLKDFRAKATLDSTASEQRNPDLT